jgi:hypothetical protein
MAARPTLIVPCGAPATVATGSPAEADWRAAWLGWLDAALHREILRLRARYALSSDELRGLYVTDVQVDRLLSAAEDPRHGAEGGDDGHDHELAALEDYCRSQIATLHETSSPLTGVQREFRLTDAEVRALVVCLAPETDLRYQPVFAYLNDDATRRLPTIDLCLRLGDGGNALLDPGSPLFAEGLVDVVRPAGTVWRAAGLALRHPVRTHLLGLTATAGPAPTGQGPRGVTLVAGDDGEDAAKAAARERDVDVVLVEPPLDDGPDLSDALVRARLTGAVVHAPLPGTRPAAPAIRRLLAAPVPIVLGEDWQVHLGGVEHEVVRPGHASSTRAARALHTLRTLAQEVPLTYDWEDLVLPAPTRGRLEELCSSIARRGSVFDAWGFRRLSGGLASLRVLFTGGSGTGKTMSAAVVARDTGLDLYQVDVSAVVSKYIGETEKHLEQVFRAAELTGSILFFDEADALFGKRSEVSDAHDRYANVETSYLLQRVERFAGVLVLATNLASNLDEAFSRRLHLEVEFPLPDDDARLSLWRKAIPAAAPSAGDVDHAWLAQRFALTGGEIRNVALGAALLAAHEETPIGMSHLVRALGRQRTRQGRLPTGAEFGEHLHLVREA